MFIVDNLVGNHDHEAMEPDTATYQLRGQPLLARHIDKYSSEPQPLFLLHNIERVIAVGLVHVIIKRGARDARARVLPQRQAADRQQDG